MGVWGGFYFHACMRVGRRAAVSILSFCSVGLRGGGNFDIILFSKLVVEVMPVIGGAPKNT